MIIYNNKTKMEILLFQEKGFRIGNQRSIYNKRDGQLTNKDKWKR